MQVGDLVKCTHGSGSGTVGIIVAFTVERLTTLAHLNNGDCFGIERLEVLSESR
jgi:hypothetical protein